MNTTIIDEVSLLAPVGKTKAPKTTISGSADIMVPVALKKFSSAGSQVLPMRMLRAGWTI